MLPWYVNTLNHCFICFRLQFASYMESSCQSFQLYTWYIALPFLSSFLFFAKKENGCDVLIQGIYKLLDTMFLRTRNWMFSMNLNYHLIKTSATSMFLSLVIFCARICLISGSITATIPIPVPKPWPSFVFETW